MSDLVRARTVYRTVALDDRARELFGNDVEGGPTAAIADLLAAGQETRAIVRLARCCEACFRGDASLSDTPPAYYASWAPKKARREETATVRPAAGAKFWRGVIDEKVLAAKVDMERRRAATDDDNSNKKNGDNQ